jgi:putative oxidoreductase
MKDFLENKKDYFYFVFRVVVGLLFLLHGLQKIPGIFNGATSIFSLIGLAGIIETVGGAFLVIGLLTRYVALISAVEMLVAYFMAHFPNGLSPLANKGESALLYFAAFLVMMAFGSKKWALDKMMK